MPNPIFRTLSGNMPQNPIMQQFPKFMRMMRGKDPNQILNGLISSGKVSQSQLDIAQNQARQTGDMLEQFKSMFGF